MANVSRSLFYFGFASFDKYDKIREDLTSYQQDGSLVNKTAFIVSFNQ